MVIRQRAIAAEDKHERFHAMLDAAERLLARAPDRIANVAEVADEAGLAKGTVYLYFDSKDALLLALHERHLDEFFRAMGAVLDARDPVTIDRLVGLVRTHIVARDTFLPLATRCFGLLGTEVPREVAAAFRARMAERLDSAGALLDRRFPRLSPGADVALLRHSYALIVGLWQMSAASPPAVEPDATCGIRPGDYPDELSRALHNLWQGALGTPPSAPNAVGAPPAAPNAARAP